MIDAMHRYAYVSAVEYARPSDRLLEIGFGEGYGSEIVGPRVAEYVGVEVDDDAVLHAARTYQDLNRSFLRYDGARLPFDDGTFDLIISFQVIEHVDNPAGFLEEARRVMKATGSALIVTPNRNHRVLDGERPFNRYHVREFNPPELEALMREAFENVVLFGIHGSSAMSEIEKRRVAKARRLARLDPLGLDTSFRSRSTRGSVVGCDGDRVRKPALLRRRSVRRSCTARLTMSQPHSISWRWAVVRPGLAPSSAP